MKKRFWIPAVILGALLLLVILAPKNENKDTVTFYYARQDYKFGSPDGTIGFEERSVGRRNKDYSYLLTLYLEGPLSPNLKTPFPGKNIEQVQTVDLEDGVATITLADLGVGMTDSQFCLSCAALSKTCIALTDAHTVKISSGERSVTMTLQNLLLYDDSASVERIDQEERK